MLPSRAALPRNDKPDTCGSIISDVVIDTLESLAPTSEYRLSLLHLQSVLLIHDVLDPRIELLAHLVLWNITLGSKFQCLDGVFHCAESSHQEEHLIIPHLPHPA